jgi:hypothetical protein
MPNKPISDWLYSSPDPNAEIPEAETPWPPRKEIEMHDAANTKKSDRLLGRAWVVFFN